MQDILTYIQNTLNLPERDGTNLNNLSVSVAEVDFDSVSGGSIVIRGQPEILSGINQFSALATNNNPTTPAPSYFNSNMVVTQLRAARNSEITNLSFAIYDKIGAEHTCTLRLTPTNQILPSLWKWQILTSNGDSLIAGGNDEISFGTDGSPSSFGVKNSSNQIKIISSNNRSDTIKFSINWGLKGSFTGITQFFSQTTISLDSLDGYPAGLLESYTIDTKGLISGNFDNGQTFPLWQIALCNFPCREGLRSIGSGYFFKTELSGDPVFGNVGKTLRSVLITGAVEK
jgi:flagellar hook protein FlgE